MLSRGLSGEKELLMGKGSAVHSPQDQQKQGRKEEEGAVVCLESCELQRECREVDMRGEWFAWEF